MTEEESFEVTPWDVEGNVDYQKLIEKFGTKRINPSLKKRFFKDAGEENLYMKRDFVFSHRDLEKVLDDYENGEGFFLYTGVGPSGPMHIGHIIAFQMTQWIQEKFDVNVYIQFPDDEKFWSRDVDYDDIEKFAEDNLKDIAAVGFDPDKTFVFKNTEYIGHMYKAASKVAEKINNSVASAVFGFDSSTNIGLNFYPALQLLPTFFEDKRCLIPAGIDQDPYWRIQRDIAPKFGYKKAAQVHNKFVPALTGPEGKMSSSKPKTAVMLSDSPEEAKDKILQEAYSGGKQSKEEHREKGADLSVDVAYQWLYNLFMQDDERVEEIGRKYENGEMLTGEIKQILGEKLGEFLKEHQRRKEEKGDELVEKMMYEGNLAKKMWDKKIQL
ncbi:MAG: tryptophan--tRNA ligase [Candidatus Nanohaloarchaeota archaeon QJJ-9]|nr:tryptophan--tRNA ligase [Candidatus Nanohaloarchaeota archaeon QJJ-9]